MKKYLLFLIIPAIFIFYRCTNSNKTTTTAAVNGFNITFNAVIPPDLAANATEQQLAEFAWNEFLALNWKSSYSKDGLRDNPDTAWNYGNDLSPYPDHVVWETYAHRTELRPYSDSMANFNTAPHYSINNPPVAYQNASYTLFDNLDEGNEIGSCNLFAHANQYNTQYQVLYQAKVNKFEYNYLKNNYNKNALLYAANGVSATNDSLISFTPCDSAKVTGSFCLPCGSLGTNTAGAVEVKTAWRQLAPGDDSTKFFTRKVIVYSKINGTTYYQNKTYALIGLHIIHKTQNYPAFVFATFEHVNVVQDSMDYQVITGSSLGKLTPAKRLHPITAVADSATAVAHRLIVQKNPKSIWQYYRLVGVQGTPVDYSNAGSDPNFFLANFVVETDSTLANFNGSGIGMPTNHQPNLFYQGKAISMGGCQGCHGVAQRFGGNSSFVMLAGKSLPNFQPDYLSADPGEKFRKLLMLTTKPVAKKK
jgi:hypothetical protein